MVTTEGEGGWVDVSPAVLELGDKWSQLRVKGVVLMFLPQSWRSGTSGHRSAQFYTCDVIYRLAEFVFVKHVYDPPKMREIAIWSPTNLSTTSIGWRSIHLY